MIARLGFSIATAWTPDILILDEVLAVGDASFTAKCEERIAAFHAAGTTVLLVSHSAADIRKNCQRVVWLDDGELRADGPAERVLDRYAHAGTEPATHASGRRGA
jgi:ABC-type polysaccharide/polyol phosphate transport system ATPase subunit